MVNIHSVPRSLAPEPQLADRLLTCAACNRTLRTDEDGTLPLHAKGDSPYTCPGSYTPGYPPRPLPEIKPLKIEMLPDDEEPPKNIAAIIECVRFLNDWLGPGRMRIDNVQMSKIVAHTTRARDGALHLLST